MSFYAFICGSIPVFCVLRQIVKSINAPISHGSGSSGTSALLLFGQLNRQEPCGQIVNTAHDIRLSVHILLLGTSCASLFPVCLECFSAPWCQYGLSHGPAMRSDWIRSQRRRTRRRPTGALWCCQSGSDSGYDWAWNCRDSRDQYASAVAGVQRGAGPVGFRLIFK